MVTAPVCSVTVPAKARTRSAAVPDNAPSVSFNVIAPVVLALICMLFGCSNGFAVANSMTGAINSSKFNKGAASGLMGAFQVGSGGLAGFLIIYFGGAQNFNICLYALFIMSGISIISSYMTSQLKKMSIL